MMEAAPVTATKEAALNGFHRTFQHMLLECISAQRFIGGSSAIQVTIRPFSNVAFLRPEIDWTLLASMNYHTNR